MKNQPGFTLVELLIYIGLLLIFLTIVTRIFTAITDVQLESTAAGVVEEDSRYIYVRLSYDIGRGVPTTSYSINGGNLMVAGEQLNSVGTTISDVSFQPLGNSVHIKFTVTSTTQHVSGPDTKNMETTIALR